jgi:hypothetical protein
MVVVVGGHARKVGKTSVICGVIRALPDWNWTAVKIAAHEGPSTFFEETGPSLHSDSGRYLAAGARRALFIETPLAAFEEMMPRLRSILNASENNIVESNAILRFLDPDVCAMVLDDSVPDRKPSSGWFRDRADLVVAVQPGHFESPALVDRILLKSRRAPADLSPR